MALSLYDDLNWRGLIKQSTSNELKNHLDQKKMTLYCGFDPTADSLHVGSMLQLMTLKRFQRAGHKVIAVVGGATGMIGDPSGKSQERNLLNDDQLKKNQMGITQVIERFLDMKGANPAIVTNNYDWFQSMSFIEFLRDVGKHFTVNHMMAKESVRARLEDREHGISYTEFSYMLLQSYDYYILHQKYGCNLQIGGSDQWGNITAGIELIRRIKAHHSKNPSIEEPDTVFGVTSPLVNKADGSKFGKSEQGTVWLSHDRTSPYQLYQFFLQTADLDVIPFIKFFTFLSHEEILALETSVKAAPEKREAQKKLADEIVKLVHGEEALNQSQAATSALFSGGSTSEDLKKLSLDAINQMFAGAPTLVKLKSLLQSGTPLVDLLVESTLCASKGAARKDILGGGIYLNNDRVTDPALTIQPADLIAQSVLVLRKGKKSYHLIQFV
jgi:tyrosyl-tRNA synthetase